jgi:hypothetical protein
MTTTFSTKALLRVHRYAGLIAAPLVLFFAVSGIWQVFRLQDTRKDGSYTAPKALAVASDLHKAEDLKAAGAMGLAFKVSISAIGVILTTTTLLGITVALRVTRPRWLAILLLLVGAALPPILYFLAT